MIPIEWMLVLLLTVALWSDFKWGIIPNELIYIGTTGWILNGLVRGLDTSIYFAVMTQLIILLLVLFPLFAMGALGAGDVKLFLMCACFLEGKNMLPFVVGALVIGALIGAIKLLREDIWSERIYYFFSYIKEIAVQKKWMLYQEELAGGIDVSRIRTIASNEIHFSLPVFISILLGIAGVY